MNLLAHAALSPHDAPGLLAGNLAADWIKGKARLALPPDLQSGIALHRRIDAFTDFHPLVDHCSNLLAPQWGRYAPILVDIFFDHVLSQDWDNHMPLTRTKLIAHAYAALRDNLHHLPPMAQYAAHMLLADDWFTCYATIDGIALSLSRVSSRLHARGHTIELAPATRDFLTHQAAFHAAFAEFFPQLRHHIESLPLSPVN